MLIGKLSSVITPKRAETIERTVTWVAPALLIPALRYTLDDPKNRDELFIRDFTTYAVGAATFLGGMALANVALMRTSLKFHPSLKRLATFTVGFTSYILYAGIGAVKLSKKLLSNKLRPERPKVPLTNFNSDIFKRNYMQNNINISPKTLVIKNLNSGKFNFASYINYTASKPIK